MKIRKENCFVITGGPGAGKTTIINELAKNGFKIISENARKIIKHQIDINGEGLPWKNTKLYSELMLKSSLKDFDSIPFTTSNIYFFDRGIPDILCYMNMMGLNFDEVKTLVKNNLYGKKVFILPPWFEIYQTDDERKQSWEETLFTFVKMKDTYLKYDYDVIEVPKDTVENRIKFILNNISQNTNL